MIDPLISLAYSIQTNPGVYALLIGSGVSRSASIPTGWEIVLDLVSKLAHIQNENCDPDPAEWYQEKYGEPPEYSKLLDSLAKSPEERQQLLSGYFEPTDDEREEGLKSPTKAHRSIAALVASGHLRVIVTTNFDRLLERAIEDEGITPVVLSTPDALQGALPIVHQRCCIIKLHGDYLDTRIRNTPQELEEYPQTVNEIIDRVLDEFGFIICGWSGQWDTALRTAFERCKSRRFSTYWATPGSLSQLAKQLLTLRSGTQINISDADTFFSDLSEKVSSLSSLNREHPLSITSANATTKKFLSDDRHTIQLHDLVSRETEKSYKSLQAIFNVFSGNNIEQEFSKGVVDFCSSIELLRNISIHGAYWGNKKQFRPFTQIPPRLSTAPDAKNDVSQLRESLRSIPSVIMLYTMGIASLAGENYGTLSSLLSTSCVWKHEKRSPYLTSLEWHEIQVWFKFLGPHKNAHFPASEWLLINCRELFREIIPDDNQFENFFDTFEFIRSLAYIDVGFKQENVSERQQFWAPGGRFVWKFARGNSADNILDDVSRQATLNKGLCESGLFQGSPERLQQILDGFRPTLLKMAERCF